MNLTEHQAKNILRDAGVRVPRGDLAKTVEKSAAIATELDQSQYVVKAQIRAGGRSQGHFKNDSQSRGGIRFVESLAQVKASTAQMLGNVLITNQTGALGELVKSVYVEEHVKVEAEKYLALTIDQDSGALVFIASNSGGVGIESLAQQSPDAIAKFPVDILQPQIPDSISDFFGYENAAAQELNRLLDTMLHILTDKDATLIELNPIGTTHEGELCVLDAAIVWDDNALFRQGHEEQMIAYEHLPATEFNAKCLGLNYLQFDGNIGTVSAGAGLAMAALDALHDSGGTPANFLDIPPSSSVDVIRQAISLVLLNDKVEVLLVNIIGGGIMRCDAIADALLLINEQKKISVPIVVRLAGSNASLAMQRLDASLPESFVTSDLASAITKAAELSNVQQGRGEKSKSAHKPWWQRVVKPNASSTN